MKKLSLLVLVLIFACGGKLKAEEKPNIVFILIDDMGWKDVGFMGSEFYETPNIDKLADKGMRFTQAYANAANCAPTRSCILSGQYTPRHGVYTVGNSNRGKAQLRRLLAYENSLSISLDKITIAEALKPAGYVSAAIGKWHVGNTPQEQGFDFGIDRDEMGYKGHLKEGAAYLADSLTDIAINFIEKNNPKETGKPFFVYLAHHSVHTPIQAKEGYSKKYEKKEGVGCQSQAEYAAMVQSVDESVARINNSLEELGLSENTILIFFSDNGGHGTYTCQRPLRGGKGMYYEGGIREPMFVYWPGTVKAGTSCGQPVISTDFYPTFLKLAGAETPQNYTLDGADITPLFRGKNSLKREPLFWYFPAYLQAYSGLTDESRDPAFRTRPVSVIRDGDWKLLLFHEEWSLDGGREKISTNNSVELYNLKKDISETTNLANIETKKRDELLEKLFRLQEKTGASIVNNPNPKYKSE
ncbi:sulfatase-like hydrolase/transferase [Maribellus comscasis]|uniref:Sulfatase-like hydrolase/transferase n=1 Tax=Maribellus comscasis TaxID=2681766 RepID=A0A6I6JQX2_9BACT|nr:sulfatase [Maribellus comscasis]QGY44781.1 sulfatase-like hydrolase/transferase [Maribellus comscasis]